MKEKVKRWLEKFLQKRRKYIEALKRPCFFSSPQKDYVEGVLYEYKFTDEELIKILSKWDANVEVSELKVSVLLRKEFNRLGSSRLDLQYKGKTVAIFIIMEDLKWILENQLLTSSLEEKQHANV